MKSIYSESGEVPEKTSHQQQGQSGYGYSRHLNIAQTSTQPSQIEDPGKGVLRTRRYFEAFEDLFIFIPSNMDVEHYLLSGGDL